MPRGSAAFPETRCGAILARALAPTPSEVFPLDELAAAPVLAEHSAVPRPAGQGSAKRRTAEADFAHRRMVTLLVSLGLHAAGVIAVLLLLHAGVPPPDVPDKPTEVELVMEEHKGDLHPPTAPPAPPAAAPPASARTMTTTPSKQPDPSSEPASAHPTPDARPVQSPPEETVGAPPTPEHQAQDVAGQAEVAPASAAAAEAKPSPESAPPPPQPEAKMAVQAQPRPPMPPAAQPAPTVTLEGTDSPSEARAWGDRIIPAAPNAVFHNRPPEYPEEAAMNGQHGTVVVVIHISPQGTAAGVDLVRSSGYALLDRAARQAVLRWRFLPAVKDGQPIAADMTMGFVFENE